MGNENEEDARQDRQSMAASVYLKERKELIDIEGGRPRVMTRP